VPDRTRDIVKKRVSTNARKIRFRARLRAKRELEVKLAKETHKAELAARRAAAGLPPKLTSTERARRCRERQAQAAEAVRLTQWFSPPFKDDREASAYLVGEKPDLPPATIESILETTRNEVRRWDLHWNRYVVTHSVMAARIRRAIVWQFLHFKFDDDLEHLKEAMARAEIRIAHGKGLALEETGHPAFHEQNRYLDLSQVMLGTGRLCFKVQTETTPLLSESRPGSSQQSSCDDDLSISCRNSF
jgi:hypothetical protein